MSQLASAWVHPFGVGYVPADSKQEVLAGLRPVSAPAVTAARNSSSWTMANASLWSPATLQRGSMNATPPIEGKLLSLFLNPKSVWNEHEPGLTTSSGTRNSRPRQRLHVVLRSVRKPVLHRDT